MPADYNPQKEREARRTVFVDNLNPFLTAEHILNYFQFCGDIRYLRIGGDWMEKRRYNQWLIFLNILCFSEKHFLL